MIIETIKMNKLALSNLGGLLAAVCLLAAALSKASPLAMEAGKLTWPAPYYEQPGRGQLVGWLSPDRSPLLEPFEDETSFANLAGPGAMQARLLRDGPSQRNSGIIVDSQPVRGARRPQGDQSERANIPPEFLESLYKAALGRFERTPLARPLVSGSGPTRSLNAGLAAAAPAKRVENSRWNNLRGMWGKRSLPTETGTTNIQELASQD